LSVYNVLLFSLMLPSGIAKYESTIDQELVDAAAYLSGMQTLRVRSPNGSTFLREMAVVAAILIVLGIRHIKNRID